MFEKFILDLRICTKSYSYSSTDVTLYKEVTAPVIDCSSKQVSFHGPKGRETLAFKSLYPAMDWLSIDIVIETGESLMGKRDITITQKLKKKFLAQGFQPTKPNEFKEAYERSLKRSNIADQEERKLQGYVVPGEGTKKVEELQGGFTDEVFEQKELQNYLKGRNKDGYIIAFGFIGHSGRKTTLDEKIERYLRSLNWTPQEIGVWLTSSEGRHFMDNFNEETTLVGSTFTNYHRTGE